MADPRDRTNLDNGTAAETGRGAAGDSSTAANVITWRKRHRYSPVQDRTGIRRPGDIEFPPAAERVTQAPDPFGVVWADEREILRATYQGDDRCQLACPGCYTRDLLQISPAQTVEQGRRKNVPHAEFTAHLDALGPGMQDLYVLGAEPTMDPAGTAAKLEHACSRGWPQQVITHGAVSVDRFEETFGAALDSGQVYMLIISLDSMDPAVNNRLRGRPYAHERTLGIIRHCIARGAPFKVQMTVWPLNYATILGSVEELFNLGVRAFSFHCGTLEGVTDAEADAAGLMPIDPLAWRALADRLLDFRDANDGLWHFNVPFLYFTEDELREQVIGDDGQTTAYLEHVDAVEAGRPSVKPVHACPALDVPQVYVWANRGPQGRGTLSLCNIDRDPVADAYADYDPRARRWRVRTDPERNQLRHLADSPHLCPATPYALRTRTDRAVTEIGPLFHACRYIASNQMPAPTRIRPEIYRDAAEFYRAVGRGLDSYPPADGVGESPVARIARVTSGIVALTDRTRALNTDLNTAAVRKSD